MDIMKLQLILFIYSCESGILAAERSAAGVCYKEKWKISVIYAALCVKTDVRSTIESVPMACQKKKSEKTPPVSRDIVQCVKRSVLMMSLSAVPDRQWPGSRAGFEKSQKLHFCILSLFLYLFIILINNNDKQINIFNLHYCLKKDTF